MEDLNAVNKRVHKIMMTNRRTCTINGVCDVLSFDIHEILLETDQGMLMIKGDELHVNRLMLDKGGSGCGWQNGQPDIFGNFRTEWKKRIPACQIIQVRRMYGKPCCTGKSVFVLFRYHGHLHHLSI